MQLCTLWGNMSADRTDEQYPQLNVCEECALCEKHISEE